MALKLRRNEFTQPDYVVVSIDETGRETLVGRIFCKTAGAPAGRPWFWSVDFFHRKGRAAPHQDYVASEAEAKAAWRRCWDSAATSPSAASKARPDSSP
jgi:hypothetical protein